MLVYRLTLVVAAIAMIVAAAPVVAAPAGVQGDAQAIAEWQAAQQKFNSASAWRSRRTFSVSGQTVTQATEYVAPDRFRLVFATDASGRPSGQVTIGTDTWIFGGGSCAKNLAGGVARQGPNDRDITRTEGTVEVTKGGIETVEGTSTQTYTVVFTSSGAQMRQKSFVARDSGYYRRIETTSSQGSFTTDYFDYNTAITITPPC
jgi:outer membrane lipoprotein-sorting protein